VEEQKQTDMLQSTIEDEPSPANHGGHDESSLGQEPATLDDSINTIINNNKIFQRRFQSSAPSK
jgi:hypothetical protein